MKKFLSYVLTFVLLFVISAAVTISLNSSGNDIRLQIEEQTNAFSAFSGILSAFEEHKQFSVQGGIDLSNGNTEISVDVYLDADIAENSNLKFNGEIAIDYSKGRQVIKFSYFNNNVYLTYNNSSFILRSATIGDVVDLVKDLLPESEANENKSEFDTNSLMQELMLALGNMEETVNEDGSKTIHVNYKDMLDVTLSTDSEEKPTRVVAVANNIEGFDANVDVGLKFDEGIIINNPEKIHPEREYIDVGNFVKAIDNTLSMKKFKILGQVNYREENYNANILVDLQNKVYQANALEKFAVTYASEGLFLDLAGAKVLLKNSLFEGLGNSGLSQKAVSKIVASKEVGNIVEKIKQIDAATIIKCVENFSIANDGIRLVIGGEELGIENIEVFLKIENEKIDSLEVETKINGENLSAVISLEETNQTIELNKDEYLDIEKLYNNNIEFFKTEKLAINLGAAFEGEKNLSFSGKVLLDFAKDYYNASLNVFAGQEFRARFIKDGSNIFAAINDIRVRASEEQLGELLKTLDVSNSVDSNEISSKLKDWVGGLSLETIVQKLGLVKEFELTNAGLKVMLSGELFNQSKNVVINLELENERVKKLSISSLELGGETVSLYIDIENNDFEKTIVREKDYLDVLEVYEKLKNLNLSKGSVFSSVKVNYAGKEYNASIAFKGSESKNRLSFVVSIKELGVDIDAQLIDGEIYLKFNNMLVKAPMNMFGGAKLGDESTQNIVGKLKEIEAVKNVINNLKDLKIEKLAMLKDVVVTSSTIQFSLDKELFGAEKDVWIAINLYNGEISGFNIVDLELERDLTVSLSATLYYAEPNFAKINEETYLDISALIENFKAIDFTKGSVKANASVLYNGKTYEADLSFRGSKENARVSASVELKNALNLSARVELVDGELYLNVQNIFIKLPTSLFAKAKIGDISNINTNEIASNLENLEIVKKLKNIFENFNVEMLKELKNITINSQKVELTIGKDLLGTANDIELLLEFSDGELKKVEINNLELDYNLTVSISAELSFNEPTFENIANEEKYLDYNKLVNGIYSLLESQNLALTGSVDILLSDGYNMNFGLDIKRKMLGSELMGMAIINLLAGTDKLSISSLLANNTIYASYNGLNIKINKDDISSAVNRVCALLGIEKSRYEKYLNAANNILAGDRLDLAISNIFDINSLLSSKTGSINTQSIEVSLDDILEILNNIQINSETIFVELGSKITNMAEKLTISITLEDHMLTSLKVSGLEINETQIEIDLALSYEEQTIEKVSEEDESKYIDLYQLSKVGEAVYHTLETGSISGEFILEFEFMGEKEPVKVSYSIKIENKKLVAKLTTTFKGLFVVIDIVDDTFYLNIEGLKVNLAFSEITDLIDFINSEFNTKITIADEIKAKLDELKQNKGQKKSLSEIIHSIAGLDLAFVSSVTYGENTLEAYFGNVKVFVVYGEEIERVEFTSGKIFVELTCLDFNEAKIPPIDKTGYEPYTILIDTYLNIKKTLAQKQFLATADATSYKGGKVADKAEVDVALDIENAIKASGHISVSGSKKMELDVKYQNKTLYVNYNSLKVKMVENSIQQILFIAFDLVGLQPETIGFLKKAGENLDFSSENFSGAVKISSPLKYLTYISGFELEEIKENDISKTLLSVHLRGEKIYSKGTGDMRLAITISDAGVEKIQLFNIYTGDGDEYFNFTLIFGSLDNFKVEDVVDEGYLDISPSPDLLNGLINSAGLKEYYITGKVNLSLNGFEFFEKLFGSLVTLEVNASIKVDDKGNPTIAVHIGNFPLVGGATNGNSNASISLSRKRAISIFYKDNMIYLKTDDQKVDKLLINVDQFIRETKVPVSYFMSNFEYYLNWLLGFESSISNKIHEAIVKAQSAPIDYTSLIEAYEFANGRHKITINSHALTHDESNSLGSIVVGLTTSEYQLTKSNEKEVKDTESRHYIHALDIEAELLGLMTLNTNDNDRLFLNLNKDETTQAEFDQNIKDAESYMNSYSGNPYQEFVKEGSGSRNPAGSETFTVTLDSNGGSKVSAVTGVKGDKIVLPTPTKVFDDNSTKRIEYKFVGWKIKGTDKFFGKDEYFHENVELVAEWKVESEKYYYRVTYNKNGGGANYGMRVLEGTAVSLGNLTRAYFDNYGTADIVKYRTDYSFAGWTLDGEIVSSLVMPNHDIELVAKWDETTRYYRTVKFNVNNPYSLENPSSITKLEGEQIVLEGLKTINEPIADAENSFIVKEFANWFYMDAGRKVVLCAGDSFTFEKDVELFAEFREVERIIMKRLIVIDPLAAEPLFNGLMTAGKDFDFGEFTSQIVKDPATTQFYTAYNAETRSYNFNALYPNWIMPETDLTLYVRNMYTISLTAKGDHGEFNVSDTQKRYQDELVPLMNLSSYEKTYNAADANTARWTYTFASWQDGEGNTITTESTMPNHDITLTAKFNIFTEYCIYFDTTFYRPSDIHSWPTILEEPTTIGAVWVAAGTKNYNVNLKTSSVKVRYFTERTYSASWSTTKPYDENFLGRNVNNGKETIINTIASVDTWYYLYAVWTR